MYVDLSCYQNTDTEDAVREAVFNGIKLHVSGFSILPYFLQPIRDFVLEGMTLASPIDYPMGSAESSVRGHGILVAIRKGVNTIDLVANNVLLSNAQFGKFYDDIESCNALCKENSVTLRVMLEYRLHEPEKVVTIGNGLREIGIEYIFPSTGANLDAWDDNLTMAVELTQKANIRVITNGNIWKKSHFETIKASPVFGARLNSNAAMISVLK